MNNIFPEYTDIIFRKNNGVETVQISIRDFVIKDGVLKKYNGNDTEVTIPDGVTNINDFAFDWCKSTSINIPDSVTSIGDCAFEVCRSLTSINVSENNRNFCSCDGVLYNKNMTEIIKYPMNRKENSFSIPDSVISIGDDSFAYCSKLKKVFALAHFKGQLDKCFPIHY